VRVRRGRFTRHLDRWYVESWDFTALRVTVCKGSGYTAIHRNPQVVKRHGK
jgi:hypothetical protein